MPQRLLPIFPDAVTPIKDLLSVVKQDGQVVYFHGVLPVFRHAEEDLATFRMITAQFIAPGHLRVVDVSRAFGVPALSVKRALKRYRQEGPKGFYVPPRRRGPAVLTAEVLKQAQVLLDDGQAVSRVATELGIKSDTLSKAVRAGRLRVPAAKGTCAVVSSTKSERSALDSAAPMGVGASHVEARVAASVGGLNAVAPQFQAAVDVPRGGVLFALPALLAVGLLEGCEELTLPPGYYGIDSLLIQYFLDLHLVQSVHADILCQHSGRDCIFYSAPYGGPIQLDILCKPDLKLCASFPVINDTGCPAPDRNIAGGMPDNYCRPLVGLFQYDHPRRGEGRWRAWFA